MQTSSQYSTNHYQYDNAETIEAVKWLHSLQETLADCETKIYTGEYTTIETVLDRALHKAVFTAIRKLEILGYYDNDFDDLAGK